MKKDPLSLSLVDYLGYRAGCVCLSDLRRLSPAQRACLLKVVEKLAPEEVSLWEWKDALSYLTGQKETEQTAGQARQALLDWLKEK